LLEVNASDGAAREIPECAGTRAHRWPGCPTALAWW
jgi:hypothetical protein